jgi:hypothetical protein
MHPTVTIPATTKDGYQPERQQQWRKVLHAATATSLEREARGGKVCRSPLPAGSNAKVAMASESAALPCSRHYNDSRFAFLPAKSTAYAKHLDSSRSVPG